MAALDDGPAVLAGGIEDRGDGTTGMPGITNVFRNDGVPGRGSWWQVISPLLPVRADAAMAALPTTHQIVVFGGAGEAGLLGDTQVWSGSQWTAVA
jgi:hypothetical protein